MLKTLGAAAMQDIIGMLSREEKFFTFDAATRKTVFKKALSSYSEAFAHYMTSVSEKQFLADVERAIQVITGLERPAKNGFLDALASDISLELGRALDQLNSDFFFLDYDERMKKLTALLPGKSALARYTRDLFVEGTYQGITEMANTALNTLKELPVIVVQSPVELSMQQRTDIRKSFLDKYPFSFTEFQINPQIIGGMRVFVNGQVTDHSWLAKVQAITNIVIK